jgi:hypothetical protein
VERLVAQDAGVVDDDVDLAERSRSRACTISGPPSGVATLDVLATASPPRRVISSTTRSAAPLSLPVPSTAPPRSFTTISAPRGEQQRVLAPETRLPRR